VPAPPKTDAKTTAKDGVAVQPAPGTEEVAPGIEKSADGPPTFSNPFVKDRRQSDEWGECQYDFTYCGSP